MSVTNIISVEIFVLYFVVNSQIVIHTEIYQKFWPKSQKEYEYWPEFF